MCVRRDRFVCFFFLMIRRPPRSTLDRSSAASDVYKRQAANYFRTGCTPITLEDELEMIANGNFLENDYPIAVSYTHLRAHETVLDIVCRLLLEKKKKQKTQKKKTNKKKKKSIAHNTVTKAHMRYQ